MTLILLVAAIITAASMCVATCIAISDREPLTVLGGFAVGVLLSLLSLAVTIPVSRFHSSQRQAHAECEARGYQWVRKGGDTDYCWYGDRNQIDLDVEIEAP